MMNPRGPSDTVVQGHGGLTGVDKLRRLEAAYGHLDGAALICAIAVGEFPGRAAVASSMGSESAVLLALVARVAPTLPVLFLETGMLFPETLDYARTLTAQLGLEDVRWLAPEPVLLARRDPDRDLWIGDPDGCCYLRKARPLKTALHSFDCWISGVKRAHGGVRGDVRPIELEEGRIKVNPLALWTAEEIERAFVDWELPRHPLVEKGYRSIGCIPCTRAARPGEEPRAGRWADRDKTECGIHGALHAKTSGIHGALHAKTKGGDG